MTAVEPIRTGSTVIQVGDEAKKYKTLEVSGKVDKNSAATQIFDGVSYSKVKLNLNGKTVYAYIADDVDPEELSAKEEEKCDPDYKSTDGKDDGSISGEEMFTSALKGIWKPIKGMFNFSTLKDGLMSCAKIAGAVLLGAACIVFPVVGVIAGIIGCVLGAATAVVGGIQAACAKTDAQAKHAWENIGNGAFTAITSALGLKAIKGAAATKAAAIENATGQAPGTVNKLGSLSNFKSSSDTIKSYGILGKLWAKTCSAAKSVKDFFVAPFRSGAKETVANINSNAKGLSGLKIRTRWGVFDSKLTNADANLSTIQNLNSAAISALKSTDSSGASIVPQVTEAFKCISKAKAIIPYLNESDQAAAVAMIAETAGKLDAIPAMTTSLKGVGGLMTVTGAQDNPINIFSTPESMPVYKLS